MKSFEDLKVWVKSKDLFLEVYNHFANAKGYYFKDQICRAALSISNNIADGYERQTQKEFRQFLFIAKGSCGELRSMFLLARELKLISESESSEIVSKAIEVSKMISGLIKAIEN